MVDSPASRTHQHTALWSDQRDGQAAGSDGGYVSSSDASYQVFVSHATADKFLAIILCEKLESAGLTTFRDDRDIDGGDDIPDAIRRQIRRSQELVVLLTPESIDRPWVLLEVGMALGWRKDYRIVALLCHVGVEPIPTMLRSKKAISINDFESYVAEVKKRAEKRSR